MRIHLDQIREPGFPVDEVLSPAALDAVLEAEGEGSVFHAAGEGRLTGTLRRVDAGVLVDARLEAPLEAECGRCLQTVRLDLDVPFTLTLRSRPKVAAPPPGVDPVKAERAVEKAERRQDSETAGSFTLEDADEDVFEGKTLDLDPIYREQLLLALPMNALCEESCAGLCSRCGQNLNDAKCGCDVREVDPRLAALQNVKLT